jgi:hypothetical protein
MKLGPEHHTVFDIFETYNIGRGQFLPTQILNSEWIKTHGEVRENWRHVIKGLKDSGYIIFDPLGFGLSEKGHDLIHRPADQGSSR